MGSLPRGVFTTCPEAARRVEASDEFKVIRRSTGEVLRICKGSISVADIQKAARCAGYQGKFKAYGMSTFQLDESDFPRKGDVYIVREKKSSKQTRVFNICETTSTAPVRRAPVVNTKKEILKKAISSMESSVSNMKELLRQL